MTKIKNRHYFFIFIKIKMRGKSGRSSSNTGNNAMSGLIAGGLGYVGGSVATGGGNASIGDGMKCDVNNDSQYCKDVKNYNRFQMIVYIISTIIGAILFFIALYYIYNMYFSKK